MTGPEHYAEAERLLESCQLTAQPWSTTKRRWDNDVPWRHRECADCAAHYGREFDLHPIPPDQPYHYWLGDERPQPPDPLDGVA